MIPTVTITPNPKEGEALLDFFPGTLFEYPEHRLMLLQELRELLMPYVATGIHSPGAKAALEYQANRHLASKVAEGTLRHTESGWVVTSVSLRRR